MSKCSNCGTKITCSCQRRVAKDGKAGCTKCITNLNIKASNAQIQPATIAPTNVKAGYNGPGIQLGDL